MTVLLTADSVRVEFGELVAVRDASFDVAGGQLVGLVGPNGAGKTTLLRVLAGLHAPTSGRALVFGKPVMGEHEVVRHHVGFGPDSPPAYEELTIDQFLRFITSAYGIPKQEAGERVDFWLEQLWLTEKRGTAIKTLSRGMRQRLTLARTFIPRPHVILLDEPLAGLDPAGRIQLRGVLHRLRQQGSAMIVSSHILADLEDVATHIAIIEQGCIIRWSETEALRYEYQERRDYRIATVDHSSDWTKRLEAVEGVFNVRREDCTYTFEYSADEEAAADLLKRLVAEDIGVLSFTTVTRSLEEAYIQSGVRQVD